MSRRSLPLLEKINGELVESKYTATTTSEINIAGRETNYLDTDNPEEGQEDQPAQQPQQQPDQQPPDDNTSPAPAPAALPDPTENTTNRFLIGRLINVKCHNQGKGSYSIRQRVGSSGGHKFFKSTSTYRRMFFFADMLSSGDVFATFEQNNNDTSTMFHYQRKDSLKIGDYVLLLEPDPVEHVMPGDVYKVTTERHWIMIKPPKLGYDIPPSSPSEGKQQFFFVKNKKVSVHGFTPVRSVCNSSFCDRQKTINSMEGEGCGCYHSDSRICGFVLLTHVKVNLPVLGTQRMRGF